MTQCVSFIMRLILVLDLIIKMAGGDIYATVLNKIFLKIVVLYALPILDFLKQ